MAIVVALWVAFSRVCLSMKTEIAPRSRDEISEVDQNVAFHHQIHSEVDGEVAFVAVSNRHDDDGGRHQDNLHAWGSLRIAKIICTNDWHGVCLG